MRLQEIKEIVYKWFHSALVRQFAANSIWLTIARCAWILSAFTVGILVARKLGPHNYGIVSYTVAYVGMFSVIASLGVDSVVERDYILHPERRSRIMGNYFLFKLTTTLIMLAALAVSLCFMNDRRIAVFCAIVGAGYISYPGNVVNLIFSAHVKNEYNAFSQLICCVCYNGLRLWAVLSSQALIVYVIAETILAGLGGLLCFIFYCLKCGNPLHWSWKWKESATLIIPAIPLSLTAILSNIYARTDLLMLEHYEGPVSVGCYTIATRFTENWYLFTAIFGGVFSVAVISGFKTSPEEYRKQLHRYIFMLFYITFPPVLLSLIFGRLVIHILYGQAYMAAVPVFYIYVLTLISSAVLGGFNCHAINEHRLKTVAAVFCSGAAINVPMNMLLIQKIGMCGAALSSVISMPLGFILVLCFNAKGREDLRFVFYSLTHLPSFTLNEKI